MVVVMSSSKQIVRMIFVKLLFFIEGEYMSDIGIICWNNVYCKGLKTVQNASEFTLK